MALAKKDDQLTDKQGKTYIIQRFLGEGVTAEVYEAVDGDGVRSALKILRPELPADIKQSFRNEGVILGQLATYGREKYPEWAEPLVPQVYGQTAPNTTPEFLALEFVSGQSLDELIAEKGGVEEKTSLKIARQILQVLVVLHEKLHRSYTDFQLKNIWCLAGTELTKNPTIKIMDWNHVSDEEKSGRPPALVPNDLIRFGAYLFQLLTGKGALQTGETEAELLKRAGTKWSEISVATRAVLKKALHPRPEERYQTAAALLADVQELLALWEGDIDDLFDTATKTMRAAQKYTTEELRNIPAAEYANYNNLLFTAEKSLDIYLRRDPQSSAAERLRGDLSRITAEVSFLWKAGHNFYEAEIFSEALSRWETEAQNLQRLDLWRWVLLARMGKELGTEQFKKVQKAAEEAVTALATQKWQTALDKLAPIRQQNNQLGWLYQEAQLRLAGEDARRLTASQDWGKAAESYKQMLSLLPQIGDKTYAQWIASEVGTVENLQAHIQKSLAAGQSAAAGQQVVSEFKAKAQQGGAGIRYLTDKLLENPHQPALLQAVVEQSRQMQLHQAVELLSTAAFFGQSYPAVQEQLRDLRQKLEEQKLEASQKAYESKVQAELEAYQRQLEQKRREEQALEAADRQTAIDNNNAKLAQAINDRHWLDMQNIASSLGGAINPKLKDKLVNYLEQAKTAEDWRSAAQWGEVLLSVLAGSGQGHQSSDYDERQSYVNEMGYRHRLTKVLNDWDHYLAMGTLDLARNSQTEAENLFKQLSESDYKNRLRAEIDKRREKLEKAIIDIRQTIPLEDLFEKFSRLSYKDLQGVVNSMKETLDNLNSNYKGVKDGLQRLEKEKASNVTVFFSSFLVVLVLLGTAAAGGYLVKTSYLDKFNQDIQNLATQVSASPALPTAEAIGPLETRIASLENLLTMGTPTTSSTVTAVAVDTSVTPTPTATLEPTATPTPLLPLSLEVTPSTEFTSTVPISSFEQLKEIEPLINTGTLDTYYWPTTYTFKITNGSFEVDENQAVFVRQGENRLPVTWQILSSPDLTPVDFGGAITSTLSTPSAELTLSGKEVSTWFNDLEEGEYVIEWSIGQEKLSSTPVSLNKPVTIPAFTGVLRGLAKRVMEDAQPDRGNKNADLTVLGYVCLNFQNLGSTYLLLAVTRSDKEGVYWLSNVNYPLLNELNQNDPKFKELIEEFSELQNCLEPAIRAKNTPPVSPPSSPITNTETTTTTTDLP